MPSLGFWGGLISLCQPTSKGVGPCLDLGEGHMHSLVVSKGQDALALIKQWSLALTYG